MEKISIKDIAKALNIKTNLQGDILKISTDSRDIDENTLFIALIGERFDAHNFVKDVLDKGAKAVVCSKNVGDDQRILYVEDTNKALLDIASFYRMKFEIPVVALTGSVGKTTSKGMIYAVLSEKLDTLKTQGNLNNNIGVPKTLFNLENHHEAAVIEMGMNHFNEISVLSKTVKPTIGCITNVGTAHIENLGSREGILKAKTEILDGMEKGSTLIVNGDNDMLSSFCNVDYKIIKFGIDNEHLDMRASHIKSNALGSEFTVTFKDEKAEVFVPSVGIHNVYNALLAMCVAKELGFSLKEAAKGVLNFKPEGMRQKITVIDDITFIEDCYNANLDSMTASLDALKTLGKGKCIAVLGDMLELGNFSEEAHRLVGKKSAEVGCDFVLTYGEMSRWISDEAKNNGAFAVHFDSKQELADFLFGILSPNDAVLFKGSRGVKMEEVFLCLYEKLGYNSLDT